MQHFIHRTMKPKNRKVAARLKSIQGDFNMSLSGMAELLGLNKSTYNSYIRGLALPPLQVAEKIISFYSFNKAITVQWFYYGDIVEYIRDYLRFKGHGKFIDRHPSVPYEVYLAYDVATCGPDPTEDVNPTDEDIDVFFKKIYHEYKEVFSS